MQHWDQLAEPEFIRKKEVCFSWARHCPSLKAASMEVILGPGTREPPGVVNTAQCTETIRIAKFSEAEEEIKN